MDGGCDGSMVRWFGEIFLVDERIMECSVMNFEMGWRMDVIECNEQIVTSCVEFRWEFRSLLPAWEVRYLRDVVCDIT